ncbi:MAG: AIR synthase-related protein, partial [Candidatus Saccharimonadales bacterium]
ASALSAFGAKEIGASRGESAYVWEESDAYRALVVEGLGTKNLVADAVSEFTGKSHYDTIAQDAIAMIVNDLIVVGALPQVINAYWAVGDNEWMRDKRRAGDLINGWADACKSIGATWGGGETPILKGVISPNTIDIGGSSIGLIKPKNRLVLGDKLSAQDAIVLIESSGIHANGITFVRGLAAKDPDIYKAPLNDGRKFGEAILTPTHLYVNLVRNLLEAGVDPHYMVNITGHGWRKLMRANKDFSYEISELPPVPAEFGFMRERSGADDKEMYGNFNMGAGFAVYVAPDDVPAVVDLAAKSGLKAYNCGVVKDGDKQVVIKPKNITFAGSSLEVR